MILGANHIAISVPDMAQALAFYRDLLGLKVSHEFAWEKDSPPAEIAGRILAVEGTAAQLVVIDAGSVLIELFEFKAGDPKPQDPSHRVIDHGYTHLCFAVTDVDAEYDRLTAAGVQFHCAPQQVLPGIRTVYGRDPFGNVIEFEQVDGRTAAAQPALPGTH